MSDQTTDQDAGQTPAHDTAHPRLVALSEAGVSIWLDDLSRERIETGNLTDLIASSSVVGVTTNPSIFAAALADGERYDEQVAGLTRAGASVNDVVTELTTDDVRNACDQFMEIYEATEGVDGRVSIEVAPTLAFDTEGTIEQAKLLWRKVDRPNVLIKIPATSQGMAAITEAIGSGISVNVTLIFGLDRYAEVMDAYLSGLEQAKVNGEDLSKIHSVASFFVSRVDTEADARLEKVGTDEAMALRGKAAVANARLAYRAYEETFAAERFKTLAEQGARPQRPLWASTGVKNPDYSDTLYVTDLVTENVVNTMPEKTMQAFADHGELTGDTIKDSYADAQQVMDALAEHGIDYDDVIETLEAEGVDKFVVSWRELLETVENQMKSSTEGSQEA